MNIRKRFNNRGIAIVMALGFSFCLLILVLGMWVSQRNVATQNRVTLQQQQAFFAGRSAMQHFLVKSRLMPTELYDAVAFSAGKNPLFTFNEYTKSADVYFERAGENKDMIGPQSFIPYCLKKSGDFVEPDKNGKARFLYMALDGDSNPTVFVRLGSYYNPMFRFLHSSLVTADTGKRGRYIEADANALNAYNNPALPTYKNKYLEYYLRDCTNVPTPVFTGQVAPFKLQPLLVIGRAPGASPKLWKLGDSYSMFDVNNPNQFPYTMSYRVASISMAAMKELKKYGEEAIQIEVEGMIVDFQGKVFKSRQTKTQKINRQGVL